MVKQNFIVKDPCPCQKSGPTDGQSEDISVKTALFYITMFKY